MRFFSILFVLFLLLSIPCSYSQTFTFIQVSDVHVPHSNSLAFVRSLKDVGPVYMEPYKVTSAKPAFVIATGDITEFGGGYWKDYVSACQETGLTWYNTPGNHDNTWSCIRPEIRKMYHRHCYSFDYQGCHFVILDSATPQEPTPTFSREQVEWLKQDLSTVQLTTPVFVFCHHPLGGSEFISSYEQTRVTDLLKSYISVIFAAGHYHSPRLQEYNGFPVIVGGQGYADLAGYNVFYVQDGYLRVAYRKISEPNATTAILEKQLIHRDPVPSLEVSIDNPELLARSQVTIQYQIQNTESALVSSKIRLDDKHTIALQLKEKAGTLSFALPDGLIPGQHFGMMTVQTADKKKLHKTLRFEVKTDKKRWDLQLGGSFKAGPVLGPKFVYAGGLDGNIYAVDKLSGKLAWSYATSGEIVGRILYANQALFAASSDGKIYCFSPDGALLWTKDTGVALYAHPVLFDNTLVVCNKEGNVTAISPSDGKTLWEKKYATYTIESRPFFYEGDIYLGAWDCKIYRIRLQDGTLVWSGKGIGSATKPAPAYYSPADCGPVVSQGKLYATDRAYLMGEWNVSTGEVIRGLEKIAAIALSEDQKSLYLRKTSKELEKMEIGGSTLWTTPEICDSVPTPPTEFGGKVYACSAGGNLSVLDAATGKLLWQYQITPSLRIYGEIAADSTGVYAADMDGKITALGD